MKSHPPLTVALIDPQKRPEMGVLAEFFHQMPHLTISRMTGVPAALPDTDAVITIDGDMLADAAGPFQRLVESGGAWLHLTAYSQTSLPGLFGVQPAAAGPFSELRVSFTDSGHPAAERMATDIYLPGRFQELIVTADDVETILMADWQFTQRAVAVCRTVGQGRAAVTTLPAGEAGPVQRVLYRLLCHATGRPFGQTLGIGILGYAPSVGRLHGLGCRATEGLTLKAVCDLNPTQLETACRDFSGLRCHEDAGRLAADPDVDLVVVATPPNTHAQLCLQMLAAGKHVVCEKPLAITRRETGALTALAQEKGLHLSCHQNRRFDEDFVAIQRAVAAGRIGELFYLETFVGGFGHPCNHWHSHAPVCGGTAYDWGAHYLDWIVALMPEKALSVVGTRHKRVWHDVTNADQERIQIRFAGGKEAEFIHSDIAAIRKPKWYLLGTTGAIIGQWRETIVYRSDPDIYFQWDEIPTTEMPPQIRIHHRLPSGEIDVIEPAMLGTHSPTFLSENRRFQYAFHRNLADHLLTGEPLAAPLEDSVKVVHILEAAARSMANGGKEELISD